MTANSQIADPFRLALPGSRGNSDSRVPQRQWYARNPRPSTPGVQEAKFACYWARRHTESFSSGFSGSCLSVSLARITCRDGPVSNAKHDAPGNDLAVCRAKANERQAQLRLTKNARYDSSRVIVGDHWVHAFDIPVQHVVTDSHDKAVHFRFSFCRSSRRASIKVPPVSIKALTSSLKRLSSHATRSFAADSAISSFGTSESRTSPYSSAHRA